MARFPLIVRSFPALLLALLLGLSACRGAAPAPVSVYGDLQQAATDGTIAREEAALLLYKARKALKLVPDDTPPPHTGLRKLKPRRVFFLLHRPGIAPLPLSGIGNTLDEAIASALSRTTLDPDRREGLRIQLELLASISPVSLDASLKPEPPELGTYGYSVVGNDGQVGFVLPSELIHEDMYQTGKNAGFNRKRIIKMLARRSKLSEAEVEDSTIYRIETDAFVEAASGGDPLPVLRGMAQVDRPATPDRYLEAVRMGADYLVRINDEKGRYLYRYDATNDRDAGGYNMLRHSGTTYALLEAYEETGDERYLQVAERALGYLEGRLFPRPDWVTTRPGLENFIHLVDEEAGEQSKTGGAGLALIALSKHAALTGDGRRLERMRALARFLQHMQREDGKFISYFQYRQDVEEEQKDVLYYPGEAMLGLLRLYAMDPNPQWLETVRRGADYLINTRDADKTEDNIDHDHWLSMALNELYRITKHEPYAEHAFKIARAIMRRQKGEDSPAKDFVGSFYALPNSCPASVRLEAYAADITLARFMERSDADYMRAAQAVAGFVMSQQFDAENAYFLPNPAKALGGLRESVASNFVQIDNVQHALSGLLGYARAVRDPAYGKTGVPAVRPVKALTIPDTAQPLPPLSTAELKSDKNKKKAAGGKDQKSSNQAADKPQGAPAGGSAAGGAKPSDDKTSKAAEGEEEGE